MSPITVTVILIVLFWFASALYRQYKRNSLLPPGPPGLPLIGSIHQLPIKNRFLKFTEWAREFGGIYSLKLLNTSIVIISDIRMVREVLDRQGAITADRPGLHLVVQATNGMDFAFLTGPLWRRLRKDVIHILSREAIAGYIPLITAEISKTMQHLAESPERLQGHFERHAFSIILSIIFGMRISDSESPVLATFKKSLNEYAEAGGSGVGPLLDMFPVLQYTPEWSGLAQWKKLVRQIKSERGGLLEKLTSVCEMRLREGHRTGSYIERMLLRQEEVGTTREEIRQQGGTMLDGGGGSTAGQIRVAITYLISFPECMKRAQAEIDSVVPDTRAPLFEDIAELKYLQAFLKEVQRSRPMAPLAVPHATAEDCMVDGYLIPKGTTIVLNTWGVLHDPDIFDDPEGFNPERYMNNDTGVKPGVDPDLMRNTIIFGARRRICPGIDFATTITLLTLANVIWAFDIGPTPQTPEFKDLVDVERWSQGFILEPNSFSCDIRPRSEEKLRQIRALADAHESESDLAMPLTSFSSAK